MSCSSCKYLKENDKKQGQVCGSCYYCSRKNCYVNGSNNKCNEFEKSYTRSTYLCNEIYENGEKYYDDTTPISFYITLLIILSIIALISNI